MTYLYCENVVDLDPIPHVIEEAGIEPILYNVLHIVLLQIVW